MFANRKKPYRLGNFLIDVIMTLVTSGLWLVWVFLREYQLREAA